MYRHLPSKSGKNIITNLSGLLLLLIASLHIVRIINGLDVVVSGWVMPMWISYVAASFAIYIAVIMFKMDK